MRGREVLSELNNGFSKIKNNYKYIKSLSKQGEEGLSSGEWLLDNIYLVEKEYKSIKENMPHDYFYNLPYSDKNLDGNVQRIYSYAKEFIKKYEGIVTEDKAISFIQSKDEKFTMGELWAFPIMLRIAIILELSDVTDMLKNVQNEKKLGKDIAYNIIDSINKNDLENILAYINEHYENIEGLFKDELLKVLRDNSIEEKRVYDLIEQKSSGSSDKESVKKYFIEGSIEQNISTYISALRSIESISWKNFFDSTSIVEKKLQTDPYGTYEKMDFKSKDYYRHSIEKLARNFQVDEITLTEKALYLATRAKEEGKRAYRTHVGYYIIDDGVKDLSNELNLHVKVNNKFSEGLYITINIVCTMMIVSAILAFSYILGAHFSTGQLIVSALLMIVPANEIVVALINWSVSKLKPIRHVPKIDLSEGIPDNKKTIIVIPAILPNAKRTEELMKQLEVSYLGNKDKNLYFALLGDFKDSKIEKTSDEEEIIEAGFKEALRMNNKYFSGEKHFFFLSRKRIYNPKEGVYMGKERKRGKLMEFMNLLRGEENHTFSVMSSYIGSLKDIKYIITLDADTFMPRDSAIKLVGAMSHILNRACVKNNFVKHGYGIMQPKVSISLESKDKSDFSRIFAGEGGIDGYSIAYSDTYEDLFWEGSFTGKGIIDIDAFKEVLEGEIPDNTVLSHDLLEGAYAKCALVTDVEFIDNYPSSYESSCKRIHRWVRGDWQIFKWLFSKKISVLSKWKIFDNLRRSLLAPVLLLSIILNLTFLNGSNQITFLCFLGAIVPLVFTVTDFVVTPKNMIRGTFKSMQQILLIISFIPYQAYLMADAILRTIYRMTISKKHRLQWQTAEDAERTTNNSLSSYSKRMWFSIFCGILVVVLALDERFLISIINLPLAVLWIVSPYIAYYISIPVKGEVFKLKDEDKEYLRDNTRRIWAYYQDFVNEENNFLAPDNYQEQPYKGVAHRTSPTNIGMGLISNVVAYDLGYITLGEVIDRIELILDGMKKLEKCEGHFLNWYDTQSCEPLWPRYVSTVDSGNLLGYLWVINTTLEEYKNNPLIRLQEILALRDSLKIIGLEGLINKESLNKMEVKDYIPTLEKLLLKLEEIDIENEEDNEKIYWIGKTKKEIKLKISYYQYFLDGVEKLLDNKSIKKAPSIEEFLNHLDEILGSSGEEFKEAIEDKVNSLKVLKERMDNIMLDINNMMNDMNFKFLYNNERGLFAIGYNLEENSLGNSYYDLLASESRATSFITIARGEVPSSHWFNLSRAMTNAFGGKSLVSWSGTMFEYFMPALIMKSYPNTLLQMTYDSVIKAQKNFTKTKEIPWGISESAYYQFDVADNYQYKAFGVPGIGLKRGLEDELVISPYSTLMSLPYSKDIGISNLRELEKNGAYGRYGFIEAIDYTPNRVSKMDSGEDSNDSKDVRCYMVHHLGMSLMGLDNILNNNVFQERFHRIPEVKATELLLKEKIPEKITFEHEQDLNIKKEILERENFVPRIYEGIKRENPEVLLLSNGSYSTMVTLSGSGYGKKDGMTVYRWKGDNTSDSSGMFFYIKNLNSNDYWSATYEPCKYGGEDYNAEFTLDKAKYSRRDGSIKTTMEVVVSPEDDVEVRKITLKNTGDKGRSLEVTSYMEVTLQSFEGDAVHPSFSNLFIGTEFNDVGKCLLGNRRARVKNGTVPYIFHKAITASEMEGAITYETSRVNFIGRNRDLRNPSAMDNDSALLNTVGIVLDPIMSMRVRLRLEPGDVKEVYYITGTTNDKEEALALAEEYGEVTKLDKVFNSYNKAIQLELKALGIKSSQANVYQSLASYILFLHSGRRDREDYIKNISKHQQDLWAYGISGDLPIAMAVVKGEEDMDLVRGMIKMHYYWKMKGLKVDLLIYNDEEASYEQPMQKNIISAINLSKEGDILNKTGGIFLHNKSTMGEDIKDFIIGISALYVDSEKGSIITQIKEVDTSEEVEFLRHKELVEKSKINVQINKEEKIDYGEKILRNIEELPENSVSRNNDLSKKLDFWNGYGGFDPEDKSYVIRLNNYNNTPAPWINVVSNEDFGFHISEVGSGYTWCGNSRENKITPWSNDWVIDPPGEALYIRDNNSGVYFSIAPKPVRDGGEYIIKHSFGYSTFTHTAYNIKGEMQIFCPRGEKLKIQKITLENLLDKEREVSIYYYAQLVLGVFNYGSAKYISTELEENYICGQNPYSQYFGNMRAYLTILGGETLSFTGDRKEFLGVGEDISSPNALSYKNLSNKTGSIYDPCLATETKIKLAPKEKKEIIILFGQDESKENISKLIDKYKNIEECHKALDEVKQYWSNFLGNIQVETKDKSMDYLINGWLLYQTYSCRYLSRTAFYQSGGAYGFRDQLQDSMNLGIVNPNIAKAQIIRNASRQYLEGDVQHWWHPVVNSGIRTRFSDDLLWMPYATAQYIKRTGDYSILNEKAPYLQDEPLREGEDERYTIVNNSPTEGTIYEHCIRAIEKGLKFGEHNIPLMGSGDWNDGMSTVGNKGKGESVWLGWFLCDILNDFKDICKYMKDEERLNRYSEMKEFIRENIENNAWDGGWYRRAYFDDGTPLGSRDNEECQIDSLAESWSLISGAGKNERAVEAMEAVDRNLVREDKGMILLLAPPFEKSSLEPGYIKGYVAGVRENGGQYTHAAVWVILALTKLGLGDKAWKYYNMINPINHSKTELECRTYKVEPYVMAADVYIKEPHGGRGGWSWYTGASGWMYKVGIEDILGLKHVEGKGYKVEPCVPEDWTEYNIKINNEKEHYDIKVIRGKENKIRIDGKEVDIIPKEAGTLKIEVEFK